MLVSDALHHLGVCVRVAGRIGEAEGFFKRCLAIQEISHNSLGQYNVPIDDTLRELDLCDRVAERLVKTAGL